MIEGRWLDTLFRGKAKWSTHRDALERSTLFSFQCERATPVLRVGNNLLEDAPNAASLVAEKCLELYARHHAVGSYPITSTIVTCRSCRAPVDVPFDRDVIDDFEYCERQAVLWMERAAKARRK